MARAYGGPLDGGDVEDDPDGFIDHECGGITHRYMRAMQVGILASGQLGYRIVFLWVGEVETGV